MLVFVAVAAGLTISDVTKTSGANSHTVLVRSWEVCVCVRVVRDDSSLIYIG